MEHRCGYRRPAAMKVRLRTSNGVTADAEILDISASGALVCSHLPVSPHMVLTVQLLNKLRRGASAASTVSAEVIRHVTGGFAVEWAEFSPQPIRDVLRELTREVASPRSQATSGPKVDSVAAVVARKR